MNNQGFVAFLASEAYNNTRDWVKSKITFARILKLLAIMSIPVGVATGSVLIPAAVIGIGGSMYGLYKGGEAFNSLKNSTNERKKEEISKLKEELEKLNKALDQSKSSIDENPILQRNKAISELI
jgi:uncharacterized membrane protein YhiD involved in acid resistance